jgi:dipeptidyl aminopeptidase/acylaminoacyl peptidase
MQKLSLDTLEPVGESVQLLAAAWRPSVSEDGTLLWMDPAFNRSLSRQLVWRDRAGTHIAAIGEPQQYLQSVELSPDGGRAVYSATLSINRDIWVLDLARSVQSRFTTDAEFDGAPVWSPNGKEIAFRSSRSGAGDIYVQPADGSAPARLVLGGPETDFPRTWSPDGTTILFVRQSNSSSQDLWSITRKPDGAFGEPAPFLQSKGNETTPGFSPDGRDVVYASDESGRSEVYVRSSPSGGERVQISTNGGLYPRWSRNGKEFFFLKGETLFSVPVTMQPVLRVGAPVALFKQPDAAGVFAPFDATADGKRFLISEAAESSAGRSLSLHVIQNWRAMARQ